MTQKTKLKIIGPYTPEHKGPFCTRGGLPVRVLCTDVKGTWPIVAAVLLDSGKEAIDCYAENGRSSSGEQSYRDLMNAEEIPQPCEFWINEFRRGDGKIGYSHNHYTPLDADNERSELKGWNWTRTIHVREVMPGEG